MQGSRSTDGSIGTGTTRIRRQVRRRIRLALWRLVFTLAIIVGLGLGLAQHADVARAAVIDAARVLDRAETTRVELSLDRSVTFRLSVLGEPDRVVVDLPELRWSVPPGERRGRGVVTGLRAGQFKPGTTRVVIDCRRPVRVHTAELTRVSTGRYRLVIDVETHGGADAADRPALIGNTGLPIGDVGDDAPFAVAALSARQPFAAPRPRPAALPHSAPPRPPAQWVVAIDPGHGGRDPGATGRSGIHEKQITLAFARQLRDELRALRRYRVVMTRDRDVFIRLRDRTRIAQAAGADLFVSIHADKMADSETRGLSVYTLSERASDAEAAALAERENKSDLIAGLDLASQPRDVQNLLIDIAQRETMNRSADFAGTLVRQLREDVVLLPKAHRFAGFAVLKAPDVPSVLVELGYLSNPTEERLLRRPEYRKRLARALSRAVNAYFVRDEAHSGR